MQKAIDYIPKTTDEWMELKIKKKTGEGGNCSMTDFNILEAMNETEVTEIKDMSKKKNKNRYRRVAALVALFLVVSGTTVFATTNLRVDIINMFSNEEESGYDVNLDIEPIAFADIKGEVRELSTVFIKNFTVDNPTSNVYPGSYSRKFDSLETMAEYIGCDNLFLPEWTEKPECVLEVNGNEEGKIEWICTEVGYENTSCSMQIFSTIYTEDYKDEFMVGLRAASYESYEESDYRSSNGINWKIVTADGLEEDNVAKEGYAVIDNVLYNVHIVYAQKDEETAVKQFYEYLDLYNER